MNIRKTYLIPFGLILAVAGATFVMAIAVQGWTIEGWAYTTTAITAIVAALYATYQHLAGRKVQRQEKSSQIMKTYAANFVHRTAIVNEIISQNPSIHAIINKVDRRKPLRFTREELLRFPITTREIGKYTKFMQESQLKDLELTGVDKKKYAVTDFLPADEVNNLPKRQNLSTYIADTLNGLEYICMEIESGAADDNYLYGSVHQTFINFVHNVAISIQNINVKSVGDENYYPYISRTYRRWVDKENKNHKTTEAAYGKVEKKRDKKANNL